jgi:hypothetical protein
MFAASAAASRAPKPVLANGQSSGFTSTVYITCVEFGDSDFRVNAVVGRLGPFTTVSSSLPGRSYHVTR